MLTIDLTEDVLREARESGVQMIIAYHPIIFRPLNRISDETLTQHIVLEAARSGIAVFSPHTALDAERGARSVAVEAQHRYRDLVVSAHVICLPEIARATTRRWISEVPSKIV
jgi:putative NIF3 family GTP cyclohydrolase 1 type 2